MKTFRTPGAILVLALLSLFYKSPGPEGAWQLADNGSTQVIIFSDGYFTHTSFDRAAKSFSSTRGGSYVWKEGKLSVSWEFDSADPSRVGSRSEYSAIPGSSLRTNLTGKDAQWQVIDDGSTSLHGLWEITQRKENGNLVQIHQQGTRKTIKILSSTRFQWAAIDPGTKKFMGTGGGTYSFEKGKYTEHIEFFSRDSSRVGQSLSFEGKLEGDNWHHRGQSSKGEPIYEVWSRTGRVN
ncbi:MAG: membrane or secreted protein [Chitinophagaceae bacterium]|nr:MAG: membrane or secreted protein [Chitinophagaceae bacterium]